MDILLSDEICLRFLNLIVVNTLPKLKLTARCSGLWKNCSYIWCQWTTYKEGDDVIIVETSAGYVWRIIDEIG